MTTDWATYLHRVLDAKGVVLTDSDEIEIPHWLRGEPNPADLWLNNLPADLEARRNELTELQIERQQVAEFRRTCTTTYWRPEAEGTDYRFDMSDWRAVFDEMVNERIELLGRDLTDLELTEIGQQSLASLTDLQTVAYQWDLAVEQQMWAAAAKKIRGAR
jgi:hypothetical protein